MGTGKAEAALGGPPSPGASESAASAANDTAFDQLVALVRREAEPEAWHEGTLRRRIARRRRQLQLPDEQAYLDHLRRHPDEVRVLRRAGPAGGTPPTLLSRGHARTPPPVADDAAPPAAAPGAASRGVAVVPGPVFEVAPCALLVVDAQQRISAANRRARALFGRSRAGLLGAPIAQLIPAGLTAPPQASAALGMDGRVVNARDASGREFPVQMQVDALPRAEGDTVCVIALQDLRLQAEAQRLLAAHQDELRRQVDERSAAAHEAEVQRQLILESTGDGLLAVDLDGRISLVNAPASRMLHSADDAALGRPALQWLRLASPDGRLLDEDRHPVVCTLRDGVPCRLDHALLCRRDRSRVPVVVDARPMRRDGEVVGAVVCLRDITERLAAEQAREAALAEARRLAQVRTEFLTNMSHEIRTPLNAVLGLAEVAARGDRDHTPEQTFARILDAGQLLLGVVNDILDFAKIEAGKLHVEAQPVELGLVIDRAVALVAPRVCAKGLRFTVHEAPDLPQRVQGDALRLTQVLGNLLSNALKFTERGGIELRVWCDLHDLRFAVHDSGIGIAPGQLQRLFKPFEQVDASTSRRFGGSGLGLVISQHLMALMGGEIAVRSTAGAGSTFTVRLPMHGAEPHGASGNGECVVLTGLHDVDHVPELLQRIGLQVETLPPGAAFGEAVSLVVIGVGALQDESVAAAALAATRHGQRIAVVTHPLAPELPSPLRGAVLLLDAPLRARHVVACVRDTARPPPHPAGNVGRLAGLFVLAAEDNEVNALVLEAVMRMEGAELTLVDNGPLAVERVRAAGPGYYDLVLTDIQMPGMDGYAATRAMLELDPALPVVGLTAHAMAEERERCRAAGMVDHLAKPIEVEQLVASVLAHRRRRAQPAVEQIDPDDGDAD